MQQYLVKFNSKCVEVRLAGDTIRISGRLELEIRQRVIIIRGALSHKQIYSIRENRKKAVYVRHSGIGFECQDSQRVLDDLSSPLARIKYTETRLGGYLTIVTSGQFSIDYIVISKDTIVLILPGRREIFTEESDDTLILYLV